MDNEALRFIRWGAGLTMLGLVTGYFPLGHYLMKDSLPSCPAAPVHGHTVLLSFVGMTLFGLTYRALPTWTSDDEPPLTLVRAHFWCAVVGVIGVCVNGTIGYELLGALGQPDFYYIGEAGQFVRNLWFGIDGAFLSVYGIGCVLFLYVVMSATRYRDSVSLRFQESTVGPVSDVSGRIA
jgi:heme/copper-type cytochrome/quinol oxidase subunit 1